MKAINQPTRPPWLAILGWAVLAAFIGLVVGSVLGYMWSNAQTHMTQTGYVLRGDHRAMIVIGHAMLGGLVGAVVATAATVLGLVARRKRPSKGS